jgi:hypothetical protein
MDDLAQFKDIVLGQRQGMLYIGDYSSASNAIHAAFAEAAKDGRYRPVLMNSRHIATSRAFYERVLQDKYGEEYNPWFGRLMPDLDEEKVRSQNYTSLLAAHCGPEPNARLIPGRSENGVSSIRKTPIIFVENLELMLALLDFTHVEPKEAMRRGDKRSRQFGYHLVHDLLKGKLGILCGTASSRETDVYKMTLGNPSYALNETQFVVSETRPSAGYTRRQVIGL